jgi:hypothetical protein
LFCPLCGDEVDDSQYLKHVAEVHSHEEMQDFMRSHQRKVEPIMELTRGENFSKLYATRFNIQLTEYDFRLDVLNERRIHQPGAKHQIAEVHEFISESQLIIQPIAAKILVQELSAAVEHFEEQFGEIKHPHEK